MRNSQPHNDMRAMEERPTQAEFNKALAFNHLRRSRASNSDEKLRQNSKTSNMPSQLLRWFKFNLVGGIGIVVQFLTLYLMKSVVHLNYLFATAIAVEAAVVHNFVWHEQFTWADRLRSSRHHSMRRLVRFNLANGAVSVLGNLAVMKGIVAMGHTNYLLANGIAIALCSLANFLVGEEWVFATTEE
ncbi:MAG TPA: GtrA family protein [Candidatus Sulfotelmatobacter sp.]